MNKKIKPYGLVWTNHKKYYLLEPYTERNVFSDGTFEFLVVPYFHADFNPIVFTPRFIRTTEFSLEYAVVDEIEIQVSELEE